MGGGEQVNCELCKPVLVPTVLDWLPSRQPRPGLLAGLQGPATRLPGEPLRCHSSPLCYPRGLCSGVGHWAGEDGLNPGSVLSWCPWQLPWVCLPFHALNRLQNLRGLGSDPSSKVGHFTSLGLTVLICKMGITRTPPSQVAVRMKGELWAQS